METTEQWQMTLIHDVVVAILQNGTALRLEEDKEVALVTSYGSSF